MNYEPDFSAAPSGPTRPPSLSPAEVDAWTFAKAYEDARRGLRSSGIERAYNETCDQLLGRVRESITFYVPPQKLAKVARAVNYATRDLNAAVATAGGHLVGTDVRSTIDALRPRMRLSQLGVQMVGGLRSNATLVRQGGTVTVTWQPTETTQAAETQTLSLSQVAVAPHSVTMYMDASRMQLLMAADRTGELVLRELISTSARTLEAVAIAGAGASGQPTGLLNTAGIGTFNGASITNANVLEAQTDILNANALVEEARLGYLTTPSVAQVLATRQGFSTVAPMWIGNLSAGQLAGAPAYTTTNVPAATLVAGDWSQLLIAEWGVGLEVRVNPYANFQAGIVGFAAFLTIDVAVLNSASFSVATSVS